jgi:hypothetical protein
MASVMALFMDDPQRLCCATANRIDQRAKDRLTPP